MRLVSIILVSGWLVAAAAAPAIAQSQSLTATISHTYGTSDRIVETDGEAIEDIPITHHATVFELEYGTPVKGLSISASLPLITAKWDEDSSQFPHFPTNGEWDDGDYHATVTDLRADVRYQFLDDPVELAVTLGGSIPTHDYPNFGYAAPGRHLKAAIAGIQIGGTLDPFLPRLYWAGRYEFALVEHLDTEVPETEDPRPDDFGQNRSDFSVQVGYYVLDELELNVALDGRYTHGGMDFLDFDSLPLGVQSNHDAVLNEDVIVVGGGGSYQFTDAFALGAALRFFITGSNTRDANLFSLIASYSFL